MIQPSDKQITFDNMFLKNKDAITTFTGCAIVVVVFAITFCFLSFFSSANKLFMYNNSSADDKSSKGSGHFVLRPTLTGISIKNRFVF